MIPYSALKPFIHCPESLNTIHNAKADSPAGSFSEGKKFSLTENYDRNVSFDASKIQSQDKFL